MDLTLFGKYLTSADRQHLALFGPRATHEFTASADFLCLKFSSWDERRVADWLHTINCAQYEQLFKGQYLSDYLCSSVSILT